MVLQKLALSMIEMCDGYRAFPLVFFECYAIVTENVELLA